MKPLLWKFKVTFNKQKVDQIYQTFAYIAVRAKNFAPLFRNTIAPLLSKITILNFETYGSRLGKRWSSLSPKYQRWKSRHFPGMPILLKTHWLYLGATMIGAPGNVVQVSPLNLIYGLKSSFYQKGKWSYPVLHQLGSPGGKIPPRPFIGLTAKDVDDIAKLMVDYVTPKPEGTKT